MVKRSFCLCKCFRRKTARKTGGRTQNQLGSAQLIHVVRSSREKSSRCFRLKLYWYEEHIGGFSKAWIKNLCTFLHCRVWNRHSSGQCSRSNRTKTFNPLWCFQSVHRVIRRILFPQIWCRLSF